MGMIVPAISELLRIVNNSTKRDSNYDIALAMIENYKEIPKLTIHELANVCFVSSSSISRFIRYIGYENFTEFRQSCSNPMGIDTDYSKETISASKEDIQPIFRRYTENIKENLDYTLDILDFDQLDRICKMIYESETLALFGLEFAMIIGQHFQTKLASLNKLVSLGISNDSQMEIAKSLDRNSVVIITSLEAGYFYRCQDVLEVLEQKDVQIIAISMSNNSKLLKNVDELLVCNKYNNNTEGRITLLYILEILIMYYSIKHQFSNE